MTKEILMDSMHVKVYQNRQELGRSAATDVAQQIMELMNKNEYISMIFAAAPSQNEFLEELIRTPSIPWNRINAFHMDEYIGLPTDAPQCFGLFLKKKLFDHVPFRFVHYIDPMDPVQECDRYTALLEKFPPDIVCLGIGENGHLAFNDPHVADFNDSELVKIVELDQYCRQQQVNDGCFAAISNVPQTAITLTIPALMAANSLYCMVPGRTKRKAVYESLYEEVSEACPASILRTHPGVRLYLDEKSFSEKI